MKPPRLTYHYFYDPVADARMMVLQDHANSRFWSFRTDNKTVDVIGDMMPHIIKRFYQKAEDDQKA